MSTVTTQIGSAVIVTGEPCPVIVYSVATFADLSTITSPEDGALVAVTAESGLSDLVVSWNEASSAWLLERVAVPWATAQPLVFSTNEDGSWYNSGGVTVNTAAGAFMAITDRCGQVYRYDPAVPRDALAGGGTCSLWLLPQEYEGTPEVQAYTVGTEDDATLGLQGWTVVESGTGSSVATDGTEIVLSTSGATGPPIARIITQTTLSAGQPCTVRGLIRGAVTNTSNADQLGVYLQDNGTSVLALQRGTTSFACRNGTGLGIRSTDSLRGSTPGTVLPIMSADPEAVEIVSPNRTDVTPVMRDGYLYHSVRRGADTTAGTVVGYTAVNTTGAAVVVNLGVRHAYVLTW